jgi:hypothetical protein
MIGRRTFPSDEEVGLRTTAAPGLLLAAATAARLAPG